MIIRIWHDVDKLLPGMKDYLPVRCINKDECSDFYFMAFYDGEWNFFDEEYNDKMQVTHWCEPIDILESDDGRYNLKEEKDNA
jgi:hypothetical protein